MSQLHLSLQFVSFILTFMKAIGDYVGAMVEGNLPKQCSSQFQVFLKCLKSADDYKVDLCTTSTTDETKKQREMLRSYFKVLHGHHPFGQVTDDTQLMREIALGLIEFAADVKAEASVEDIDIDALVKLLANRMASLYKNHRMVGAGPTTCIALTKIIKGACPLTSGGSGYGNGPLVRTLPIALLASLSNPSWTTHHFESDVSDKFSWVSKKSVVKLIENQSAITHTNSLCSEAAVTYAVALGIITSVSIAGSDCDHDPFPVEWFMNELVNDSSVSSRMKTFLGVVLSCIQTKNRSRDKHIAAASQLATIGCDEVFKKQYKVETSGINGDAVSSLSWALYSFLTSPSDFMVTLQTSVCAGGDTDSTAALACSLSGAYLGLEAIPGKLVAIIDDQESMTCGDLISLGNHLTEITTTNNHK